MISRRLKYYVRKYKWRKINKHNRTVIGSLFDIKCVSVGEHSYGEINVLNYGEGHTLKIGNYCSIASHVCFILSADHYINHISTFPFKVGILKEKSEAISKGDIVIDDDVWIGYGATILSGVHIGQGAVIAAGGVVTKDVPPYAVVGGIPAQIMKYRFPEKLIQELLQVDYGKLTPEMIREHIGELYQDLQEVSQLSWLPKRDNSS